MKTFIHISTSVCMIGLFATISGCQKSTPSTPATPTAAAASSAAQSKSLSDDLGVKVPTQEEADAAAAKEITAKDADKAFQELQKEAEGGG